MIDYPQRTANYETVRRWVEEMTNGYLTADQDTLLSGEALRVHTKDGSPVYRWRDDTPITGTIDASKVPWMVKLDGRSKKTMRWVVDLVRSLVHKIPDDNRRANLVITVLGWADAHNVKVV